MDLEYYAYAITASPRQLDTLEVFHIGIQYARVGGQVVVRNVFEGYPAARAGVRRGDVILTAGGRPFHPFLSFASSATTILTLRRNGRPLVLPVTPVHESLHRSLLRAMQNSLRRISGETGRSSTARSATN